MRFTWEIKRRLRSEKGEASYISSFLFILITFITNVFHIISVKRELDHYADQLVKQIQLAGGTNGGTDSLFSFLTVQMSDVENLAYQIDISGSSDRKMISSVFLYLAWRKNVSILIRQMTEYSIKPGLILCIMGLISGWP